MLINKGDIIEIYDDENLTICQSCIGIVEKVVGCFVIFTVAKVLNVEEFERTNPEYQELVTSLLRNARGQIRSTTLDNVIRHTTTH